MLIGVLLLAGCGRSGTYTVTIPDGRVFHGMKWKHGGTGWNGFESPGGQEIVIEGPMVIEKEAEE